MSESEDFLKYLFNEPIYVIDEGRAKNDAQANEEEVIASTPPVVEAKTTQEEPVAQSSPSEAAPEVANEQPRAKKNDILVIFDNPSGPELDSSELEYLKKILGAIQRNVDHIDFINVAVDTPEIAGYPHVIAFTPNHQLAVDKATQQYTAVSHSGSQLIVADALKNISASTELRKKLWEVLKQVFVN